MGPSSIPEILPLKAPQGVHLALSVGVPTAFLAPAVFWVTGWSPLAPGFLLATGYTLLLALWAPWRHRSSQGPLLKFWVWAVATLAFFGAQLWVPGGLVWMLAGFVQGQLGALWAGQLASRARLFQLLEGIPEGRALEERVRDFQLDADFSRANQGALVGSLVTLGVSAVGLAQFSSFGRPALTPGLLAAFLAFCFLVGVLLRTYRREMEALMYGRRLSWADKVWPLGWSGLLVVLAALGAWGLTSLGGPWFDWSVLAAGHDPPSPPPVPNPPLLRPPVGPSVGGDPRVAVVLALLAHILQLGRLVALVEGALQLVLWAVPVAVVGFFLWPLVRWFLSGGRETRGLLARWWRLLAAQVQTFADLLATWWAGPGPTTPGAVPLGPQGAREWLRSLFARPAPGRRTPYPEVVEAFLSLVRWASGVTEYHRGETTREFLDRLAALVPGQAADLVRVRDLLDRELFGPEGLGLDDRRAFLALVADLTRTEASHDPPTGVS